LSKEEENRRGS